MSLKRLMDEWPDIPVHICKGCGKKMIWGTSQEGQSVPLDPSPPAYSLMRFKDESGKWIYRCTQMGLVFVSHFSTCSKASDFSGNKKNESQ